MHHGNLFGGPYQEDITVDLLVNIEKFKIDREQMLTFAFDEARKENPRAILGGMDTAMRTCVKSDLLTFSFAAPMFVRMVTNMDKSFLTTYIWKPLMNR